MKKRPALRIISICLVFVLLANQLPLAVFAEEMESGAFNSAGFAAETEDTIAGSVSDESPFRETADDAAIVAELEENRTEFSKDFVLENGLRMSVVYPSAVHYQKDGKWQEIDNTLKLSEGRYTNTAGVWDVSFPKTMAASEGVRVEKDGYALSFRLAGAVGADGALFGAERAAKGSAQVVDMDLSAVKEAAMYAETVPEKAASRLVYEDLLPHTSVMYDLDSNRLKESIVLEQYDPEVAGYSYHLDVGELVPVMQEDGRIDFYDAAQERPVLVMPAPYLYDAAQRCSEVAVKLTEAESGYLLTYLLPRQWLSAENRQWPVVLDPIVQADLDINNIQDQTVFQNITRSYEWGMLECGYDVDYGIERIFVGYAEIPALTSADVVVSAAMTLYLGYSSDNSAPVEVHKVKSPWQASTLHWSNKPDYDPTVEDYAVVQSAGAYTWNVTDIVRGWYEGPNTGMMFKVTDAIEAAAQRNWKQFYSCNYGMYYKPTLVVKYINNTGLEGYWDYTPTSAERAGTGYVNDYTGNLVWVRKDMGFSGSRMPAEIVHVYNANDKSNNAFGMGYGWRTNYNQLVYAWSSDSTYYIWEDADATRHYFKYESSGTYADEDGSGLLLTTTGSGTAKYCITDKKGNKSYFDTYGRLTKISNNQETASSITVSYTTASGKTISKITDGVGRVYTFAYTSSMLSKIAFLGKGSAELSALRFGYAGSDLTAVTYPDGKAVRYGYTSNHLLDQATDVDGYSIRYTYNTTSAVLPNRVTAIAEYDGSTPGGALSIEYAHNQTTFTDHNGNREIMQFNNWGNTVSIQDGEGNAQFAAYAKNTTGDSGRTNQLTLASKLQSTVVNLVRNSSFEIDSYWRAAPGSTAGATWNCSTTERYLGKRALAIIRSSGSGNYTVQPTPDSYITLTPGKTYTLSAYVKTAGMGNSGGGARLAIGLSGGGIAAESDCIKTDGDWTRLEVRYTHPAGAASNTAIPYLISGSMGTAYFDCVQFELSPTASRYNLIDNGDFRYAGSTGTDAYGWAENDGCRTVDKRTTVSESAAAQMDGSVYAMTGDPELQKRCYQNLPVSGSAGDVYALAGWAKGDSIPIPDGSGRRFGIAARFYNTDGTEDEYLLSFNPDTDSAVNWQYGASRIVAKKSYSSIRILLVYERNANTVYFDGIQLYKEEFGSSYTYDKDGNVISVRDLQNQTTQYEYQSNDLTKAILPTGAALTYTYDSHHNVQTATSATGVAYRFTYDAYGNNTAVSILSGSVAQTATAAYTSDGNRIASTTDAAGNVTTYQYNENTNLLEWVQYPNDTAATRTAYTYDSMYRTASASANLSGLSTGTALTASYTYTGDRLSAIATGSTTYSFAYGSFGLRSGIQIGGRTLASYSYTDRNHYLSSLTYGNGDTLQYTYDKTGRVTKQTYEDGTTVAYQYGSDGALASVTDSATGITTQYYYDFTERLLKYAETGADLRHSVGYDYDTINNLTSLVDTINGVTHTTRYAYDKDNRVTSVTNGDASRAYTYDAYSRVSRRVTAHGGSALLTDDFAFRSPSGTTTTGQIASMTSTAAGYQKTYRYTYDKNGNILSVSDGSNTTTYVYDTANQLVRENNPAAGRTWTWTYDNGGNITARSEYAYTTGTLGTALDTVRYEYGDPDWGDLLTSYGGKAVTSDAIGNILSDGTWDYTWEHGRQLASMHRSGADADVSLRYAYNADGLRTEKTVTTKLYGLAEHTVTFTADGASVKTMTVEDGYVLKASDYPEIPEKTGYTGAWDKYAEPITQDVTVEAVYTINHYTVTFVADGVTVKTMTVDYGDTLTASDYPTVPAKTGHTGVWNKYTAPVTRNVTIQATYTINRYTVTFVADGTTVKTMTVEHGCVLQNSDYPAVPAKVGYTGIWNKFTEPVTQDITVEAVYTINQYTVTFLADGTTLKTMTVEHGYVLKDSDYPAIPEKTGYTGAWEQYPGGITQDTTVNATYTIRQYTVTFAADGTTLKTMTVEHGYVLKDADYPAVPAKVGYTGAWEQYPGGITQDTTVNATYTIRQYTVTFAAIGTTVKTMTVEHGYVLKESDYPAVPEKTGHTGVWNKYTEPVTQDITVEATYTLNQYTVTFVAEGMPVHTMTVNHGYLLQPNDYPPIPQKPGYTGAWNRYTAQVTQDITVEAVYTINQYTVTFVADGTTIKTMTVEHGYVLTDSDYPAVPEKAGYTGAWNKYTEPVTQDITIEAVYTPSRHTVTFTADGTTVKTMTVEHGYVLTDSDYPAVPAKVGYTGAWDKYTEPVTQDITVEAVYTINQYKVTFTANGTIVKTMTVDYGYTLKNADYPAVPIVNGKTGQWTRYTKPITRNITITATYSDAGINPPVKPPIETSSIDGAAFNNGALKETVIAHHTYIYTGGQLAQETITTTVTPTDGTSTPTGDIMSSGESGTTISAGSSTATAANGAVTATGSVIATVSDGATTETLYYAYDANGVPMSLTYTDPDGESTTYYYATNIQGDVTAILDTTGTPVVEYTYDAWGNILTTTGSLADTLGKLNSLRYRGYVYDTETELYYLQSRYYNPEMGRFINADNYASTGQGLLGNNMFAYCANTPVSFMDSSGTVMRMNNALIGDICFVGMGLLSISFLPTLAEAEDGISDLISRGAQDVYDFAKAVKKELAGEMEERKPVVHHIVPKGDFKNRNENIRGKIAEMHEILEKAGIDVYSSPLNLMLVSQGHHRTLHTNAYIEMVYCFIKPAKGNDYAVYFALLELRLLIAATDIYAMWY